MLMLTAQAQSGAMSLGDAGLIALLGYAVVFLGLIFLMIVVTVMGKAFTAKAANQTAPAAEAPAAEPVEAPTAPGTAGQLKLHNVDPKTAAILMAITADKMGKPINELRFISIKEVN